MINLANSSRERENIVTNFKKILKNGLTLLRRITQCCLVEDLNILTISLAIYNTETFL